jgi:uncharacterized cofD-like protein
MKQAIMMWMRRAAALLQPGIGLKRLTLMGAGGAALAGAGLAGIVRLRNSGAFAGPVDLCIILLLTGLTGILGGIGMMLIRLLRARKHGGLGVDVSWSDVFKLRKTLMKGPRIVALGGGTGMATLLRGLKKITSNLTVVVTVADDGGGSGVLREELGILPPGDIRNCIIALSDAEPYMERLLQYRFTDGKLKGQSFGNLYLAAMSGISGGFLEAVERISDILAVTGRVLPVSLDNIRLCARLNGGAVVEWESNIGVAQKEYGGHIEKVWLEPAGCTALPEALDAIREADIIVLGPGSLYTSIIPNLLVPGIAQAIRASHAVRIYATNLMTQPGETEGYDATDHLRALADHAGEGIAQCILVNNNLRIPPALMKKYLDDHAEPVTYDRAELRSVGLLVEERDLLRVEGELLRHDSDRLAAAIIDIYRQAQWRM